MKGSVLVFMILLVSLWGPQQTTAREHGQETLLEIEIKGVTIDPQSNAPIMILEDRQGHRAFPIWIGMHEAQAIALALEGTTTPRPLTHTLLQNILTHLQVEVTRIIINDLRDNTFYAAILLRQGGKVFSIDARPSDAVALALGTKAPVFVTEKVLGAVRTVTLQPFFPSQPPSRQLGLHVQALDAQLAHIFHLPNTEGVLISFVEEGSPAERSGIRRGDVITAVNSTLIKDVEGLQQALEGAGREREIILQVTRDQKAVQIPLRLPTRE